MQTSLDSYFHSNCAEMMSSLPDTRRYNGDPYNNEFGQKYLNMPIDQKRRLYKKYSTSYLRAIDVPLWPMYCKINPIRNDWKYVKPIDGEHRFSSEINMKVSIWQGDITRLEIDAIVNAANKTLLGGGGADGSIHRGAGASLKEECRLLNGCTVGEAKITSGHCLPAKFVVHTVGPMGKQPEHLRECYRNSLQLALLFDIKTIAFCCISTGLYQYPQLDAAHVALSTCRSWLQSNHHFVDRIIFCTYTNKDFEIYRELMQGVYFPCQPTRLQEEERLLENTRAKTPTEDEDHSLDVCSSLEVCTSLDPVNDVTNDISSKKCCADDAEMASQKNEFLDDIKDFKESYKK